MDDGGILEEYREWLAAWAKPKTVKLRTTTARAYLNDCGGVAEVSPRSVNAFLGRPKADGKQRDDWTRATYHSHVKSFCQFLVAAGYVESDPIDSTHSPRRPKGRPRPLTEMDVQRVLAAAKGDVRDWIVVALATGLRVSEIAKLRGEDVSSEGIYVEGKGGVYENLPAHPDVLAIAARKPGSGYWWPGSEDGHVRSQNISRKVGDLFRTLNISGSIHRARHTFGTRLIRQGHNIRTVQRLMRHASLQTTANYTAVDENELHAAVLTIPSSLPSPPNPAA